MLKKDFNVKPDMAAKIFMERPDIFADAVNFAVYKGRQIVTADSEANSDKPKVSSDEFLSSWKKDDKLVPVISIVINFSNKKWDAPLSLHEMFDTEPP